MNTQLKVATGLVSMTLAVQAVMVQPARAAEFQLGSQSRQEVFPAGGGSVADLGTFTLSAANAIAPSVLSPQASESEELQWQGLLAPPDPDADEKMYAGHDREYMSLGHMLLGGATLGLLAGAGLSGIMLVQQNDPNVRLAHQLCVSTGTLTYLADGALMLFAPRPHRSPGEKKFSNIVVHRYLFYLHLAGMTSAVLTGLIATRFWNLDSQDMGYPVRRLHPAIGATAIGAIGLSAVAMTLNF